MSGRSEIVTGATDVLVPHVGWMRYPLGDDVADFLSAGSFELAEQAFWWLYLRPGDTVVDAGAHAGLYSRLAAMATAPHGRTLAVEPLEVLTGLVQANTSDLSGVEIVRAALGSAVGSATMTVGPEGHLAYSSVQRDPPEGTGTPEQTYDTEVSAISLDELLEQRDIERVALLKLDVEGSEADALAGAAETLRRGDLRVVMIEFNEEILAQNGSSTRELLATIRNVGLIPTHFDPTSLKLVPVESDEPLWYSNVFAVVDMSEVAERLTSAPSDRKRIFADLARRSASIDHLASQASQTDAALRETNEFKAYAERTEALLREANDDRDSLRSLVEKANCDIGEFRDYSDQLETRLRELNDDRDSLLSDRDSLLSLIDDAAKWVGSEPIDGKAGTSDALLKGMEGVAAKLTEVIGSIERQIQSTTESTQPPIGNGIDRPGTDGREAVTLSGIANQAASVASKLTSSLTSERAESARKSSQILCLQSERDRARDAVANALPAVGLASRYGGALDRILRMPFGRTLIRTLSRDGAPWIDQVPNELGAVRRLWPDRGVLGDEGEEASAWKGHGPEISVILCTYNPRRDLLDWTLDSLRDQSIEPDRVEFVVVDNNSTPPLRVEDLDPDGSLNLRVVRETRPGHIRARVAGVRATSAPLIVFVDDDNALARNYLSEAASIARAHPEIGTFGGIAEAVLEVDPPGWIDDLLVHLAVRDYGPDPITSTEACWGEWDPIGAGMVVRRNVAERYVEMVESDNVNAVLGRRGKGLSSGDDTLINRCANLEGLACSYRPTLRLKHFMKASRLTLNNMRRMLEGHGRSYVALERVLGREVDVIGGVHRWRWLAQRAALRFAESARSVDRYGWRGSITRAFTLWHWDLGYAVASKTVRVGSELTESDTKAAKPRSMGIDRFRRMSGRVRRVLKREGQRVLKSTDQVPKIQRADFLASGLDAEMFRALTHLAEKGFKPTVIADVGAAKGYWSLGATTVFPNAQFYMLDPLEESRPALEEACARHDNLHHKLVAVGEAETTSTIHLTPDHDGSSLLSYYADEGEETRTIRVERLDGLAESGWLPQPTLVKIDVQGYESKVLAGGEAVIREAEVVIIEVNFFRFMPECPLAHEIIAAMSSLGFVMFDFAGHLRRPFEGDLGQADIVFVRADSPLVRSNQWA